MPTVGAVGMVFSGSWASIEGERDMLRSVPIVMGTPTGG